MPTLLIVAITALVLSIFTHALTRLNYSPIPFLAILGAYTAIFLLFRLKIRKLLEETSFVWWVLTLLAIVIVLMVLFDITLRILPLNSLQFSPYYILGACAILLLSLSFKIRSLVERNISLNIMLVGTFVLWLLWVLKTCIYLSLNYYLLVPTLPLLVAAILIYIAEDNSLIKVTTIIVFAPILFAAFAIKGSDDYECYNHRISDAQKIELQISEVGYT